MKPTNLMPALPPKTLFLIDGLGALLSAFLLGVVLVQWEPVFGMPPRVLYPLAAIAGVFAVYSLSCHFFLTQNHGPFLKGIAIANLLYCCLTLGLVVYCYSQLTALGVAYFLVEIGIVCSLAIVELKSQNLK